MQFKLYLCHTVVLFFAVCHHESQVGKNKITSQWNIIREVKQTNNVPIHTALTASYLWLSLRASFPFLQEITPRGDILGLHSIRTSPPWRASVWALSKFCEKSGAMAGEKRKERNLRIVRETVGEETDMRFNLLLVETEEERGSCYWGNESGGAP